MSGAMDEPRPLRLFLVAGEPSGDALGAKLMAALLHRQHVGIDISHGRLLKVNEHTPESFSLCIEAAGSKPPAEGVGIDMERCRRGIPQNP